MWEARVGDAACGEEEIGIENTGRRIGNNRRYEGAEGGKDVERRGVQYSTCSGGRPARPVVAVFRVRCVQGRRRSVRAGILFNGSAVQRVRSRSVAVSVS